MPELRKKYPFDKIEPKWQRYWADHKTFAARDDSAGKKLYVLDMFPYPSGAGLHVGHPEGYTATDILARYRRATGCNVLHPMGWDAFGLPAEQYAIRTGQHPRATTEANIATFKRQIKSLGFSYDWSREVDTTDPDYFKWTQWIFLKLYHSWFNPATGKAEPIETVELPADCTSEDQKREYRDSKRLAYVSEAPVNWCPELGTVLANEEVIDGKSEIGNFPVIRRPMRQWMLRITAYAERLLADLDGIDWSHSLKEMQRNWIGRSEGAEVDFQIADSSEKLRVFTTRPDTLFGATYMVLAPEHRLVDAITTEEQLTAVENYRAHTARKSDLERTELAKEKTGVFTGGYALNPVNQQKIPIWIADYVLASYGTGAIMAVPAHDERDLEFATKFSLAILQVVQPSDPAADWRGYVEEGVAINSANSEIKLDGLPTAQAKQKITAWLEAKGIGKKTVNYKLRDWLFSRQRYWGEPFPIVWRNGRHEAIPESELPLRPPPLTDYKPTPEGQPPLARAKEWANLPDGSLRETNTMPQWAGSCWYYLRYLDARNKAEFVGKRAEQYWLGTGLEKGGRAPGVDLYVGGIEHAVLHLLYARFWHKVLYDLGLVSTIEPFYKLVNQGLILGEDSQKMSKARGNVVNPDDVVREYGADTLRLYEMFLGPLEMVKPWSTRGMEGVYRFLGKVWRLFVDEASETEFEQNLTTNPADGAAHVEKIKLSDSIKDVEAGPAQLKVLHSCIKKVTEDLDGLRFNTAISALMVFVNEAMKWPVKPRGVLREFLVLLQPFAPHLAEEMFSKLSAGEANPTGTLAYEPWPKFNPAFLVESTLEIPVQVNGKLRDVIQAPAEAGADELKAAALASEKVKPYLEGKNIKKVIVVPKKLVNIAVD